ncbi:MAG TPA: type II secretion system protein N [Caulobacteraceae bacterium]|nr:type II secretion system protein N [Caulobacteraceae bacterium]
MRTVGLIAVYVVALIAGLILFAPLEAALTTAPSPVTAREVTGTLWRGQLKGATISGVELGDVDVRLSPLALLTGWVRAEVASTGAIPGEAIISAGRTGWGFEGATLAAPLSTLGFSAPATGEIRLREVSAVFANGVCAGAAGQATAQIGGRTPLRLTGRPRCEGETWVLEMRRDAGADRSALRWSLGHDGRYVAQVRIATADPVYGQALEQAGFRMEQGAYVKAAKGQFR